MHLIRLWPPGRYSRGDVIQDHGYHDSGASDARFAVADRRIEADALLPIPHNFYSDLAKQARGSDTVELLLRLHLLHPMRTRILFQAENVPVHLLSDVRIEFSEIPLSGGSDFDPVAVVTCHFGFGFLMLIAIRHLAAYFL